MDNNKNNRIRINEAIDRIKKDCDLKNKEVFNAILDHAISEHISLCALFSKTSISYYKQSKKLYKGKVEEKLLDPAILKYSSAGRKPTTGRGKGIVRMIYDLSAKNESEPTYNIRFDYIYLSMDDFLKIEGLISNTLSKNLIIESQEKLIKQLKTENDKLKSIAENWRPAFEYKSIGLNIFYDVIEKFYMKNGKPIQVDGNIVGKGNEYFKKNWEHCPNDLKYREIRLIQRLIHDKKISSRDINQNNEKPALSDLTQKIN